MITICTSTTPPTARRPDGSYTGHVRVFRDGVEVVTPSRTLRARAIDAIERLLEPIAYDISPGPWDTANTVRCAQCADVVGDGDGSPVWAGDEWGAHSYPECDRCGTTVREVCLVVDAALREEAFPC